MGFWDNVRKSAEEGKQTGFPAEGVVNAVVGAATPKTKEQTAYEAQTDLLNAQNPFYKKGDAIPRAKGGCVKAGGAPKFKNVDNSGLKKEPC